MKNYWPLGVFILILAAILGMSQYADSSKRKYEQSHRQAKTASIAEDKDRKPGDHTEETYKPPVWSKYVTFPEGFGAWAIFFTLIAIVWQAIETRKAAEATRESVTLQQTAYEQWIALTDWTNINKDPPYLGHALKMSVDIVNQSSYPLTLIGGTITYGHPPDGATYNVPTNTLLIPNQPFIAEVEVPITTEDFIDYVGGSYMIAISAVINYRTVLGKIQPQEFGGLLRPKISSTWFEPHAFLNPSRQQNADHQHPKPN